MKDIKIFVSHRIDKESEIIDNPIYNNVRCGAIFDERENVDMLGDNTGDNISEKRDSFCELTVQYWAWKNVDADYYGLCHYRRYFIFSSDNYEEDIHGAVNYDTVKEAKKNMFDIDFNNEISKYDVILSKPAYFKKVGISSVYEQYGKVIELNDKDLDVTKSIIEKKYPDYINAFNKYFSGNIFYPCNMFIMKKKLFFNYSEWLFDILFELEKKIDVSNYSKEGKRCIGHIAERLLGVYIEYLKSKNEDIRIKVLQRCIVWNTDKFEYPKPIFKENNIPIVMSFSDYFVPYAAITIISLLENCNPNCNYDFNFLITDISERNKKYLEMLCADKHNISMRFINVSMYAKNRNFISNNHVSVETFYRLFVNEIFYNYDKIIYLDSDLVVLGDISTLFKLDIGSSLLAATIDADHAGEYAGAIDMVKGYTDNVLKLNNPYKYFQAGVLVYNIKEINTFLNRKDELSIIGSKREYMYVDQDVLNMVFENKVYFLDMCWNVLTDCNNFRISGIIKYAPSYIYDAYMESRKEPKIIHYAGFEKPWTNPLSDYSYIFWEYAKKTLFYEAILMRMSVNAHQYLKSMNTVTQNSNFLNFLFPKGSKRRKIAKKIYFFFK